MTPGSRSSRRSTTPPPTCCGRRSRRCTAQTFDDWELCLVDDCSPSPHVAEVLAEAARRPTPASASPAATRTAASWPRRTTPSAHRPGRVRGAARPRRQPAPRRAAPRRRGAARPRPRPTTSTPTRTRSTATAACSGPFYKPDWSPERLPHPDVHVPRERAARGRWSTEVGGFDPRSRARRTGTWCCGSPSGPDASSTCPDVLYHWRTLATSTAAEGEAAKPYAYDGRDPRPRRPTASASAFAARRRPRPRAQRRLPPAPGAAVATRRSAS